MQCHSPVQLAHYSREVETVSWSQDQRIAITSAVTVYILVSLIYHTWQEPLPLDVDLKIILPYLCLCRH